MECKKENKVAARDYEYILFDLDGTLTDPKEGITKSVAYALEYFGIEVENLDSLCKFIGPPLKESFEKYFGIDGDIGVEKYREHDIIGANKNGVDSVGVLYGYGCREEFEENHAAYIVETVEELKKLLLG